MPATKAKSKVKRTLRHQVDAWRKESACAWDKVIELSKMLDVMAKALEAANVTYEVSGLLSVQRFTQVLELRQELARKASVIQAYERAWVKGQPDPTINGRCCK